MQELLKWLEIIEDQRQQSKVQHLLTDIVAIVLFATLANADEWEEIEDFARNHEEYLREYLWLGNGIPSHDTIRRVMGMIAPEMMQQAYQKWQELLNRDEGKKLRKIICIDGKTMCSNARNGSKANHIVSAWSREDGVCLGQRATEEKSNEITAIPALLKTLAIKGQVVTIDAMGTQTEIAKTIRSQKADYVLALKGNQSSLAEDVRLYFEDDDVLKEIKAHGGYLLSKPEKAHGQIERREYYQSGDIGWLHQKKRWPGLKSIIMEKKTIFTKAGEKVERRYFISSLPLNIDLVCRAARGHWAVEIMHWYLDVTFREDANSTLDKIAAQNQNIIRKWALSILKLMDIGGRKMSLKRKRYNISTNPCKWLDQVFAL